MDNAAPVTVDTIGKDYDAMKASGRERLISSFDAGSLILLGFKRYRYDTWSDWLGVRAGWAVSASQSDFSSWHGPFY